jgi:hypothetical protein
MAEKTRLEEYHIAIQDFEDSLRGLNAATEEAGVRCEKARLACREARAAYEHEKPQSTPSPLVATCPERDAIEEQYGGAVIAYSDAVNSIRLPPRIVYGQHREKIERARNACNSVFKELEDHEREHKCTRARSTSGGA